MKKTTAEHILVHIQKFEELKETLGVDDGSPTFTLFESLLHCTLRRDWRAKKTKNTLNDLDEENEDHYTATMIDFIKLFVDEDTVLHTKERLRTVKKTRS